MRALVTLVALAALVGATPEGLAAKPKCVHLKEHDGCKLKLGGYTGTQASGGPTYGLSLTIDASNGAAVVRGAVRGACTGGGADGSKQYLPVVTAFPLPRKLAIGKTYTKTAHVDRTETSPGSNGAHLVATETVKVDMLSAKRARVTVTTKQSSNFAATADDPRACKGTGGEKLKRQY